MTKPFRLPLGRKKISENETLHGQWGEKKTCQQPNIGHNGAQRPLNISCVEITLN